MKKTKKEAISQRNCKKPMPKNMVPCPIFLVNLPVSTGKKKKRETVI